MSKILIVDDDEMNVDMLTKWLRRKGYDTIAASDGKQGIEKASTEYPDLILMDLTMPVTDGWQATRTLKSHVSTRMIPIIALSAHDTDEDRLSALDAGCIDYETKPLDLNRVTEKITIYLGASSNTG